MSQEMKSSAPSVDTLSSGESNVKPELEMVPIGVIRKMEELLNQAETDRRMSDKKAQAWKDAAEAADAWVKGYLFMTEAQFKGALAVFKRAIENARSLV